MKAVQITKYGQDVLEIVDFPRPTAGEGEVLIEVHAASVNPIDWKLADGGLRMIVPVKFPAVLGFDVSGRVIESNGSRFKEGDLVFARSGKGAGGTYAEYCVVAEEHCAPRPGVLSHEEAAAIPLAALTALQALRDKGNMQPGHDVLVNGASGGVGIFGVQIAKALGGTVTGVCGTNNTELVREMGADHIIDYKQAPPLETDREYDIIFDAVANLSWGAAKKRLKKNGVYITTVPTGSTMAGLVFSAILPGKKARFIAVKSNGRDLEFLSDLARDNKLKVVIDETFSLDQIKEAHARSRSGRARGKIVIKVR